MNWFRFPLAAIGVLIVGRAIVSMLLFSLVFKKAFEEKSSAFRPDGEEKWTTMFIGYVSWALAFSYIFGRLYPEGGLLQGACFGGLVWTLYFFPMVTAVWATIGVSRYWAVSALIVGLAESLAGGITAGLIYGWKV